MERSDIVNEQDGYFYTTKNGKRIYVPYDDYERGRNAYWKNKNNKKSSSNKKIIISKEEYGRLSGVIDSNQDKWIKGKINSQIIDDKEYYFVYNNYNDFEIVGRGEYNE